MQPVRADRLQLGQFIWSDVLPLVFGEGVQKYRTALGLTGNDHAITARSSLPFSSNALLDQAATEIGIDEPALGRKGRFDEPPSVIRSLRAKRANSFVLKALKPHPLQPFYPTM